MTSHENTSATWRGVVDQLTPEQAARFELLERSDDDPATLLAMAREMAADNVTAGVVVLSGEIAVPPDAVRTYGWQTYGGRTWREFDGSTRRVGDATIRIVGRQFGDGTCERWIGLSATYDEEFQAAQARELAAALQAIADETERLA
jgi:enoyl-CoA hydratase/carnithine racemase